MKPIDATLDPPLRYEAVEALRTLVTAASSIVNAYGVPDASFVYLHATADTDTPGTSKPDRYIVVRERVSLDMPYQTSTGDTVVPIQVMAAIDRRRPNPHKWLAAIHEAVFVAVVNQKPTLTKGRLALPFYRERMPSGAMLDDGDGVWYSTALYFGVLSRI